MFESGFMASPSAKSVKSAAKPALVLRTLTGMRRVRGKELVKCPGSLRAEASGLLDQGTADVTDAADDECCKRVRTGFWAGSMVSPSAKSADKAVLVSGRCGHSLRAETSGLLDHGFELGRSGIRGMGGGNAGEESEQGIRGDFTGVGIFGEPFCEAGGDGGESE
jgi:hypothetical protein